MEVLINRMQGQKRTLVARVCLVLVVGIGNVSYTKKENPSQGIKKIISIEKPVPSLLLSVIPSDSRLRLLGQYLASAWKFYLFSLC